MSESMRNLQYLCLWLEGPLQAWGHDSRFNRRDTLAFPTKSALFGMICAARGAGGEEREWLQSWGESQMEVIAFARRGRNDEASRLEPPLRDFHMVGSAYNFKDKWESLMVPRTSDGKKPVGGGAKLTERYYLQDACFAVILKGPAADVKAAAQALKMPAWPIFLGRKCCVPSEFIFQGVFASQDQALEHCKEMCKRKQRAPIFMVKEGEHDGEQFTLNDVPLQFGKQKKYRDRRVTVVDPPW